MLLTFVLERFSLGQVVITRGALTELTEQDVRQALVRHIEGDWGQLDEQDWKANDDALQHGGRLLSRYVTSRGTPFWIITEHDRSVTTILMPDEY